VKKFDKIDQLIRSSEQSGISDIGANDILKALFRGYPIRNMSKLLDSEREDVLKAAVWILSELGDMAEPFLWRCDDLIERDIVYVKFFVLDVILVNAGVEDSEIVKKAIKLIDDPSRAVRFKANEFAAKISLAHIEKCLNSGCLDIWAKQIQWLIDQCRTPNVEEIIATFSSNDPILNKLAAICAARIRKQDQSAIRALAHNKNSEFVSFSKSVLETWR
jgi:hypothetical protein